MDPTAIASITTAVVALAALLKWANWFSNNFVPHAVLSLSALGVGIWVFSTPAETGFYREHLFDYFAAWGLVSTSVAGVFGFVQSRTGAGLVGGTGAGNRTRIGD